MDIMTTTTKEMPAFDAVRLATSYIDIKEYWFRMECLLFKLDVTKIDPMGSMHSLLMADFARAMFRHTGMWCPFFMYGRVVKIHDFSSDV